MNGFIVSKHRQPRHQANAILSFSGTELNATDKAATFLGCRPFIFSLNFQIKI